jgi:hypothetical protein
LVGGKGKFGEDEDIRFWPGKKRKKGGLWPVFRESQKHEEGRQPLFCI